MLDEDGQPLEFEDSEEDEFIDEIVEQRENVENSDEEGAWEDCDEDGQGHGDEEMKDNTDTSVTITNNDNTEKPIDDEPKTEIWNQTKEPLAEEEELEYDSQAYTMLHRAKVEWPCLSMDCLIKERCALDGPSNPKKWFPSQLGSNEFDHTQSFMDKNNIRRHKGDRFPMTVYFVAGSQAEKKSDNKIYVMKWTDMHKTVNQDDELSDSDEENDKY